MSDVLASSSLFHDIIFTLHQYIFALSAILAISQVIASNSLRLHSYSWPYLSHRAARCAGNGCPIRYFASSPLPQFLSHGYSLIYSARVTYHSAPLKQRVSFCAYSALHYLSSWSLPIPMKYFCPMCSAAYIFQKSKSDWNLSLALHDILY